MAASSGSDLFGSGSTSTGIGLRSTKGMMLDDHPGPTVFILNRADPIAMQQILGCDLADVGLEKYMPSDDLCLGSTAYGPSRNSSDGRSRATATAESSVLDPACPGNERASVRCRRSTDRVAPMITGRTMTLPRRQPLCRASLYGRRQTSPSPHPLRGEGRGEGRSHERTRNLCLSHSDKWRQRGRCGPSSPAFSP